MPHVIGPQDGCSPLLGGSRTSSSNETAKENDHHSQRRSSISFSDAHWSTYSSPVHYIHPANGVDSMSLKPGSPIFLPSRLPFLTLSEATVFLSFPRQLHDASTVVTAVDLSAYYGTLTPPPLMYRFVCERCTTSRGVRVVEVL